MNDDLLLQIKALTLASPEGKGQGEGNVMLLTNLSSSECFIS